MKIVAVAHRAQDRAPEDFEPHLEAEVRQALKLFANESVREIYSRTDGKGAILVLEAKDEDEARTILGTLPLVELGLLELEIYGTRPYRGFVRDVA